MHVLCYCHIFPNSQEPVRGPFILRRNTYLRAYMEITVVAPLPKAPPLPWVKRWWQLAQVPAFEVIEGLDVYHPRYLKWPGSAFHRQHRAMYASALRQIRAIHRRKPIDLIEAPWLFPDALVALEVGAKLGIPVVATALGSDINEYKDEPELLEHIRTVMRQAARVICVSAALTREGAALGVDARQFAVVYNGVEGDKFKPEDRAVLRRELGLPLDRKIVVFVGHHEFIKGMDTLREAWPLVAEGDPLLVMIGSGPMREALIAELSPKGVQFVREQPHHQIGKWMAAADALLLPSYAEGIPNVLLEANASGVPIVCTDVGGVREIMAGLQDDGRAENGVMVPARNAQALARGIETVLTTDYDPERLRDNALRFNWDDCATGYLRVFTEVLEQKRGAR